MILSFKKQFEPLVMAGTKIHTLRADVKDRWDVGRKIHFATGVRTANYSCFKEGVVSGIQYVFMTYYQGRFEVSVGDTNYCDQYLDWSDIEKLARNDGFDGVDDFMKWFIPLIESSEDHCFSGKIIHWTEFRY